MGEEPKRITIFHGKAKVGEILGNLAQIQLRPEDFSSPLSLQMALSRIYDAILKSFQEGLKKKYIAEVKFVDALGNQVIVAVDLGESPPPFSKSEVKAKILIELFEEEEE